MTGLLPYEAQALGWAIAVGSASGFAFFVTAAAINETVHQLRKAWRQGHVRKGPMGSGDPPSVLLRGLGLGGGDLPRTLAVTR